jgi:hypothetical protein
MFLATTNKVHRLIYISYIEHMTVPELERGYEELKTLVQEFPAGFQLLADLGHMESIDPACMEIIGQTMELFERSGVERVVRVMPDPSKDIGLNIISAFHYSKKTRIVTCEKMADAIRALRLK